MKHPLACSLLLILIIGVLPGQDAGAQDDLAVSLGERIIDKTQVARELREFVSRRVPPLELAPSAAAWQREAGRLRRQVLQDVVFRGVPASWRRPSPAVVWLDRIETGHGYSIRTLRVEALPGLWIPALLYEPDKLEGKVPVILNVNGHAATGKVTRYKQIRCINQAKQGMIALNLEWIGMGQLRGDGYSHNHLGLLDLCGRSGLSVFYLAMSRGIDVLLDHPHADPERLAVTGLSGGGWQTIMLSSLDTRVKLAVPVAGHSGILHRLEHRSSIGDMEQVPCDLVSIADYTQLTAMMTPRPTLLIYNQRDNCCFVSGDVKPNIVDPVIPFFKQAGMGERIAYHENTDPGTHNYDLDNRQQLYRFLSTHFLGKEDPTLAEIESGDEVLSAEQLQVPLPPDNATFHSLAADAARNLPRVPARTTPRLRRGQLREVLRIPSARARLVPSNVAPRMGFYRYVVSFDELGLTAAVLVLEQKDPSATALVLADAGFASQSEKVKQLLDSGHRVICMDPLLIGQAAPPDSIGANAMLIGTVGERPLGIQVAQLQAAIEVLAAEHDFSTLVIHSVGPRTSLAATCAAALDDDRRIEDVVTAGLPDSLKTFLEPGHSFNQTPEVYCFGLLRDFDIPQLRALMNRIVDR
jgi:hypothetical protein